MKVNENLIRNCETCECYGVGCEENCPFELQEETPRRTLAEKRRNMKAEKAKAYETALQKLNSAENKAAQEEYEKSKEDRRQEIEKAARERVEEHKDMMYKDYPKSVFKARVNAIKQLERRLKRLEKNKK